MKTERVFLMELFLDDELPKKIKELIKDRFQEMDEPKVTNARTSPLQGPDWDARDAVVQTQSPSMQRLMQQNPDLIPKPPVPVTPAAAQALAARAALLNQGEKPEPGRRAPRKA